MPDITWTTLEFQENSRHRDWVWYAGLIAGLMAAVAFFYNNTFFGIFLILSGITVIIYSFHAPKELTVAISKDGVSINEELVPFSALRQFWLDESEKQDKLLLLGNTFLFPMIVLPVEGVTAQAIREALTPHIPEVQMRDSVSTKIFDRLGF